MKKTGAVLLVMLATTTFAFTLEQESRLLQPELRTAPECDGRPEFLTEMRTDLLGTLSRLPETFLVAREAEYYVEGETQGHAVKAHGFQSFLRGKDAEILCGKGSAGLHERFAVYAPTLIDTHKSAKVEQSLWQFQMMTDGNKYSFWNLHSPSYHQGESLETWLKTPGASYKVFQKSHSEYELLLVKKDAGVTQYLSVIYDAVPRLN